MSSSSGLDRHCTNGYVCYFLNLCGAKGMCQSTYIGVTNNFDRRLRQHNGQIKGGAKYTTSRMAIGTWKPVLYVSGFPDYKSALQFEWKWKKVTPRKKNEGVVRARLKALDKMFSMDRVTKKAELLSDWPLEVKWVNGGYESCDLCYYYQLRPFKIRLRAKSFEA